MRGVRVIPHIYPVEQEHLHNLKSPDCYCEPTVESVWFGGKAYKHKTIQWEARNLLILERIINKDPWMAKMLTGWVEE